MKKWISWVLSLAMICSSLAGTGMTVNAETLDVGTVTFTHQNVVGSQTCYADDVAEKEITSIPDVIQGMRINQPVFRAYFDASTAGKTFTVRQELKEGTVLKAEEVTATDAGVLEFKHVRNCEMIEILYGEDVVASLGTEKEYVNGVAITAAPMSYQIYQRDENNMAQITIKGNVSDASSVSVDIGGTSETVAIENNAFTYTKLLSTGLYDITVSSDMGEVAKYEQVGVGDIWVAAGQSNMTDMGALADGFDPETADPINENMHIIYAEDCTWQQMSHPAGEGRFFKSGTRTSPVTSFAREIAASEGVPVGIVQSSIGGTNIFQWVSGVRDSDANSGYLMNALKACFDKMPSTSVKGILWYQGCNDAINENYAYNYKNLQQRVFDEMRAFFGAGTPIITTQLNDANQDSNSSQGYYDAWSYVKDVQRQNEELYDNVYVVGTGELELGDTIHNSAAANVKLGAKWANVAKNVVYGDTSVSFRQPTIESAKVTGLNEITLTFKNTEGLKAATGTKRIGITNSLNNIALGDLTKEFVVRKGGNKVMTASNTSKGETVAIEKVEIKDNTTVVITTGEELSGVIGVDCMYGKRFSPTLVDATTNESVLAFYNVIATYENAVEVTPAVEKTATDTADLNNGTGAASDSTMYVNYYKAGSTNLVSYALMKFNLEGIDFSKIVSAKLAVYTNSVGKDRSGTITFSEIGTEWDNTASSSTLAYNSIVKNKILDINSNTASVLPTGNYSAVDITEYLKAYTGSEIGIGIASSYASDATLAGVNSENPPKLIIQTGYGVILSYAADEAACSELEVTIEGVGATEYAATKFTTDVNGKINVNLTEGTYKATTEKGTYLASSNTFTVENADVAESYTLTVNTEVPEPEPEPEPVPEEGVYTFGDEYILLKDFNTSALSETEIGDTGFKVATATSNYNNVVVRDKASTNSGYYPLGSGLPENGYYLFLGAGGNSGVAATLTLPNAVEAGKIIKITYAKPKATNNGSIERSAANSACTITVGTETIDLQNDCEFDQWYTTTVTAESEVSAITFNLGKWCAVAVASVEVANSTGDVESKFDVELSYTANEAVCSGVKVTIEGVDETVYEATEFTTDENGKVNVELGAGTYKATTEAGDYLASSNTFTVEDADVAESYTLTVNEESAEPDPAPEETVYTFGDEFLLVKDFNTSALSETEIGDTGFKVATATSNYNNVVVRDKVSTNSGYYPLGSGLPENGYYLFLGSGGNSGVAATLTLPDAVEAGKYIKITYAKPKATNNGSTERSAANSACTITIGTETIDLQNNCEFDQWYTTTVKVDNEITNFTFNLGKWSAVAVSAIEVVNSADTMELTCEETEKYITSSNATVQYTATVYNSITTLMGEDEIIARGTAGTGAEVEYSVNGYAGVSISDTGLLTITPDAQPGTVTVSAKYNGVTKSLELTLLEVADADAVTVCGDELAVKGGSVQYKALPSVDGTLIPERSTVWSIVGDNLGCTIADGLLTVPADAQSGNITIMAVLAVADKQVTENVSDTFVVTIKDDAVESPYEIQGIFLENCAATLQDAGGVDGVIIAADSAETGYKLVVKALDANGMVLAEKEVNLSGLVSGVREVKAALTFEEAALVKAYIVNADAEIVSEEIYKTDKGAYKNVPLVADWITGAKSGLGMGAGIIAPTGAPYGVDPELVDVSALNVKYTYDENYPMPTTDNALWYKTGAYLASASGANNSIYARDGADWEQKALPIGNGYMGGMLFGLPDKDQIQINEETFWAAGYRGVQTAVASNTINKNMSEAINGYMSVGNIFVEFDMPEGATVNNYYRDLNLDDSVAHVQYEYDGVTYNREYFASYPKEAMVFRYTADQAGALNFAVKPVSMHPGTVTVNDGEITIIGKLKDSEPYNSGGNAAWNQESDLEYCTKIKVIADDGTVIDGYNNVSISGATGVTVIVTAATDYDPDQFELNADGTVNMDKTPYKSVAGVQAAIEKATARMNGAAAMSYEALKAEHIADYQAQFDTVEFSLTDADEICNIPTDELQASYGSAIGTAKNADGTTSVSYAKSAYENLNKHLEELHFNYARYMMISSSRSTTMPATLQGKWCQSTAEIWGSCYCININMEMNYWFAGGANLLDSGLSLVKWFESQIPAGRITAKNMYAVTPKAYTFENGTMTFTNSTDDADDVFIMHTKQAIMGTTDMTGSTNIQSPGNTAWLMYNLWDLYQTTGDKELLAEELYPIMRKAANFYTQYLYTNMKVTTTDTETYPDGYYYTTWAGRSPEQGPTHTGIKYDLQLVAGMYDYTIAAAEVLGVDAEKVAAWKEIRNHLETPVELGEDGQIKEWAEETTYNTDANGNALGDPVHRHISHLVGLYPGTLINRETPELLEGAKIVLEKRGDDSTGWSCSNKFLLWARTLEGDKALELFRFQLAKKTYSNLFDTHAPFQIDGNFGSAAGVMELLMQSHTGEIYILPALPSVWDEGEISGIKAKNGAEVSIEWKDGKATEIRIIPALDGDVTIGYEQDDVNYVLNGSAVKFDEAGLYTIENAKAGVEYVITVGEEDTPDEPATDKTALAAYIDSVKDLKAEDYTDDSWAAYQTALAAATAVMEATNPAQAEVDKALADLTAAKEALKKAAVKTELVEYLDTVKAEGLKEDEYTEASWAAYQTALTNANAVLESGTATQAEVDAALAGLQIAVQGLTKDNSGDVSGGESDNESGGSSDDSDEESDDSSADTSESSASPTTGDNSRIELFAVLATALVAMFLVLLGKKREVE